MAQPLGEVRMVAGALPADANVLALRLASVNRHGNQRGHRRVALIEVSGQQRQTRIPVQAKRQLGQVIRAYRKTIEKLEELVGQNGVAGDLAHHNDLKTVFATFQTMGR